MQNEPPSTPSLARRRLDWRGKRVWGAAVALLVLLYLLGGFFLLPAILKPKIIAAAQESLDRPVTLAGVAVNPLLLSVDLRGLRVTEKDGKPLFGFDRLHIRLSLDSLFHRAWSFGDITLEGFKGDIVRYGANDINIARLIPAASPAKEPSAPPPRLMVRHLSIKNAAATFTDHVPAEPFTTQIGPVNAEIDHLGTLPDETGRQHLVIGLEKGTTLELTGQGGLAPLSAAGHIKAKGAYLPLLARYFGETYKLSVPSGNLEADLDYRVTKRPDGSLSGTLDHLALALDDLKAQEEGASQPFLILPHLHLTGGHLAWPEREARAEGLSLDGLDLALRRDPDGRIGPLPIEAPQAGSSPDKQKTDWSFSLGKMEVRDGKMQFEDRSLPMGGKIDIVPIALSAESLSSKPNAIFPFSLSLGLPPSGTIKLQGKASASPSLALDAKLAIAGLPVVAGQAYMHDLAKLWIEDGTLEADGNVTLKQPEGLRVAGKGEIRSLKLKDEVEQTPVVTWEHLGIDHYSYHQDANELRVAQITLDQPFVRFQIAADHSTNFSHIVVPAAPGKTTAEAEQAAAPMKISVGKVNIVKGSADYGDASLPLPYEAHITNLGGHLSALASNSSSPPSLSLKGQVNPYGEADIYGHLNPFNPTKGMNMNVAFHNVAFPSLSPYTAKFAGWRIAKGSLDVESHYQIDGTKLAGKNKVVIRDMQLGEKMDVPGALDLPLDLLVSLLKDDEGKINIDIPITGDVSDPHFDFGAVVTQEVGDLFGNILASPFRALAGLFGGGGDKLDHIDFPAGRADLEPPEKEKLQHVAELMQKKPKIDLVVAGVVDKQVDGRKLQRDALDAAMAKELGDHQTVSRQRRFLEAQFESRVGKDKLAAVKQPFAQNGDDDPGYVSALRHAVAKTEPVDDGALDKLAQSRAQAVTDALKQIPGFDAKRIEVKGIQDAKSEDDYHVPMKLDAAENGGK